MTKAELKLNVRKSLMHKTTIADIIKAVIY